MHPLVARLSTVTECEQFIQNVRESDPDLAREAQLKSIQLAAVEFGASSDVEREAIEAVIAYEAVKSSAKGKKIRAQRTWNMIKDHGIIVAVERAVNRATDASGYTALIEMGLADLSFEAVVLRHPAVFKPEVVERCKARLAQLRESTG